MWRRAVLIGVVALVGGCAARADGPIQLAQAPPAPSFLFGTVTYHEREPMPADAELVIELLETSRGPDRAAIAATRMRRLGDVPVAFALRYDPAQINERRPYGLRAEIRTGGRARWATTEPYPVLTRGNSNRAAVVVAPIAAGTAQSGG
jgi:putative lipoprotein